MLQVLRTPAAAWRPLAAVVLGVLALHAALILGWPGRVAPPLGLAAPGLLRPVLQLLPRDDARLAPSPAGDARPRQPDAPAVPDVLISAGAVVLARRQDGTPSLHVPRSPTAPADARVLPGAAPPPLDGVPLASPEAGAGTAAAVDEAADPADAGSIAAVASGEPPPLYAARPPAAATLRYALHYYGRSGEAVLSWRPSGATYVLQLQGLPQTLAAGPAAPQPPGLLGPAGPAGRRSPWRPLIEQASQGQLDANGLAPDRFTDRRRGRGQRAANFRRELGRIEFSGPSTVQPAWPGAQDRLSWWVQLPAIVAAAAAVPAEIRLFVVDARGRGDLWRFDHLGLAAGPASMGQAALQHWRHEPAQPEGQRMELWLDPAQGHWPVQLRLTSLRTGERFELQLLAIDPLPP